jgi:hypothetical protein
MKRKPDGNVAWLAATRLLMRVMFRVMISSPVGVVRSSLLLYGRCLTPLTQEARSTCMSSILCFLNSRKRPKALRSSLEFPATAWAEVRLGSHFKALGGARMGFYSFKARVRNSNREVEVVLCTTGRFLNLKGEELPESQVFEAARLEEHLVTLLLRDVSTTRGTPSCPP